MKKKNLAILFLTIIIIVGIIFVVKPKGAEGYYTRFDSSFVVRPGKGSVEIEIAGSCNNSGAPLDWKVPVAQWLISGTYSAPIHYGNITLETMEDEKETKDTKKEEKKKQ